MGALKEPRMSGSGTGFPMQTKSAESRLAELSKSGKVPALVVDYAKHIRDLTKQTDALVKKGASAAVLARHYIKVKEFRDSFEEISKALTFERDRLAYTLIPAAFEAEGSKTVTLSEGYRITITPFVRASVKEDMRQHARDWLIKNGHGDLISETINASTLSAFAKELASEGKELPDDIFSINFGRNTSVTKT